MAETTRTEIVRTERRGRVLEVTLDRPPANAIDSATSNALYRAFKVLHDDPELRVGIVTGAGERIFSAGWDLKAAAAATSRENVSGEVDGPGGFAGLTEFWGLKKPVIAAVNGYAVGGGFELALACDIILAAENAEFFLPEMQRGLLADAGGVQTLPRRIPYHVAVELLLTGRHMDAREAEHWGLVHDVVPRERLMEKARTLADTIAEGAPLALQALKEVLGATLHLSVRDAFDTLKRGRAGLPHYRRMLESEDYLEGPRAFAEKRQPAWKGK